MKQHLLHTDRARQIYAYLAERLAEYDERHDEIALAMLAQSLDSYMTLSKQIEEEGWTTDSGRRHGASTSRDAEYDKAYKLLSKFGLTPADRKKLLAEMGGAGDIDLEKELMI